MYYYLFIYYYLLIYYLIYLLLFINLLLNLFIIYYLLFIIYVVFPQTKLLYILSPCKRTKNLSIQTIVKTYKGIIMLCLLYVCLNNRL
jgi:hypothetical protein